MSPPVTESSHRERVLAIKAPVAVTLAQRRIALQTILDLVPGAMLTFDKTCDEPLELEVGGHIFACGEAVKVGDKFGIRIRSLGLPPKP